LIVPESQAPRVLHVIASIAQASGGATTATWSFLAALQLRGINADLVTTNDDGSKRFLDVPLAQFIQHRGHRVCFFSKQTDLYTTSWPMARWLYNHIADYDLVHVHGMFGFPPNVAAHAALIKGVPYVLTPHNTLGSWGMKNRRPLLKKLSLRLIEGRILRGAARVHFASDSEMEQSREVIPLQGRSVVIPLGFEFGSQKSPQAPSREVEALASFIDERLVVLFLARIHPIKRLDLLLRAFAGVRRRHSKSVLLIAGDGDQTLTRELQQLSERLGIDKQTRWLGFTTGALKHYLLSAATVFVLPSVSENFGLAVIEAQLAGVPVVTSMNVPAGNFAAKVGSGLVCDGSAEQLESSICSILDDPERARQMGASGAAAVQAEFSLDNFGRRLEELYQNVSRGLTKHV
jgi:glycosyltransferase involved in cell wall biosynthesis